MGQSGDRIDRSNWTAENHLAEHERHLGPALARSQALSRPYSVTPTFDSRVVGEPYELEVREGDRTLRLLEDARPVPQHDDPSAWQAGRERTLFRANVRTDLFEPLPGAVAREEQRRVLDGD